MFHNVNDRSIKPGQATARDPAGDKVSASADDRFHKRTSKDAAGVVEARPGILEGVSIAPLSNDEPGTDTTSIKASTGATSTVSGGAKIAYGTVTGDEATLQKGREEYYDEKH
ncbi:hypothetical protein OPQ81_005131 [Rhizoctonia solani]|nr:hypothetical protein OPQ81_005131 [Rhizoctonia solani]